MYLVEGVNASTLFSLGCFAFAASFVVAIVWSIVKEDVQGGFAIRAYVLTFLLFVGGVRKAIIQ
jgi:hypothetical protein